MRTRVVLAVLLLLANGLYAGWRLGWWATLGWAPHSVSSGEQRAPEIQPEWLILPGEPGSSTVRPPGKKGNSPAPDNRDQPVSTGKPNT